MNIKRIMTCIMVLMFSFTCAMAQGVKMTPVKQVPERHVVSSGTPISQKKATRSVSTKTPTEQGEQLHTNQSIINGELAFMGISLGETPANMVAKLKAKGFRLVTKDLETGYYRVSGMYHGMKSNIDILLNAQRKISGVVVSSAIFYNNTRAKVQLNTLLEKLVEIYGEAKEDYGSYLIKPQKGSVSIGMYDRDELESSSGEYYIGISFSKDN